MSNRPHEFIGFHEKLNKRFTVLAAYQQQPVEKGKMLSIEGYVVSVRTNKDEVADKRAAHILDRSSG